MKTFFVACGVLAVLTLTVVPSNALFGVDDNVVGHEIMLPFFMVDKDGGLDTVIVITETGKLGGYHHWHLYDRNGSQVADSRITYTVSDVSALSVRDLITNYVSSAGLTSLEVNLGGVVYYMGYIIFEDENTTSVRKNHLKAMAYFHDMPSGISTGMNLPIREVDESLLITDSKLINPTTHTEYFSANALFRAQQYIALQGKAGTVSDPNYFRLLPGYYLHSSESNNYFFIWSSTAVSGLDVIYYDSEENGISGFIYLSAGLNILDVRSILPATFLSTYPAQGWVDISIPGPYGTPTLEGDREMLGYSFQLRLNKPRVCGDTNGNGELDVGDAMYISQFLVGNRTSLSCISPSMIFSLTEMHKEAGKSQ